MTETTLATTPVVTTVADQAAPEPAAPSDALRLLHLEDNASDALLMQEYIKDVLPQAVFDSAVRLSDVTPERAASAACALVDLTLPDASGLEALLAVRGMSETLPIIVLTGFDNLELGLEAVRYGADDYLIKNHVDGYTLERAVKYSIERRRLMLELASAEVASVIATAGTIAADSAAQLATDAAALATMEADTVSAGRRGMPTPSRAAVGTHEVSVRVDEASSEYVLSCQSCDWVAGRGLDELHSWSARSLDEVLLHHVNFSASAQSGGPQVSAPAVVRRRGVFRPRGWLG
jgi:DNA-binding response OmpR family regulator